MDAKKIVIKGHGLYYRIYL